MSPTAKSVEDALASLINLAGLVGGLMDAHQDDAVRRSLAAGGPSYIPDLKRAREHLSDALSSLELARLWMEEED